MKLIPLEDRLLVEEIKEDLDTKTAAGIILPETRTNKNYCTGLVRAVGRPGSIVAGQTIVYPKGAGFEVMSDGVKMNIIRVGEVLAVVDPGTHL